MNERLAAHAVRLCGIVCRQLGWRPADFWDATPAELATIWATDAEQGQPGFSRNDLNHLMERERNGR